MDFDISGLHEIFDANSLMWWSDRRHSTRNFGDECIQELMKRKYQRPMLRRCSSPLELIWGTCIPKASSKWIIPAMVIWEMDTGPLPDAIETVAVPLIVCEPCVRLFTDAVNQSYCYRTHNIPTIRLDDRLNVHVHVHYVANAQRHRNHEMVPQSCITTGLKMHRPRFASPKIFPKCTPIQAEIPRNVIPFARCTTYTAATNSCVNATLGLGFNCQNACCAHNPSAMQSHGRRTIRRNNATPLSDRGGRQHC